jgi:hypothetical protein
MTVATQIDRSGPYAGAGTTGPFTVSFRFLDATHLLVIRTDGTGEHVLTLTTDYTVAGVGNPTGSVTLVAALPVGQTLTIIRKVPKTQEADYVQNSDFPAESHENALDKLTMISQETGEVVSRSITLPTSDSSSLTKELPISSLRARKALVFGADGSVGVSADDYNDQAANVAASAAAAAASAASASSSANSAAASYDSFDDRWLGPKASDPTLDNDGNTLLEGAAYWNISGSLLKVWSAAGGIWTAINSFLQAGVGAVARTWQDKARDIISPMDFGAAGTGSGNDGAALNLALDHMRSLITTNPNTGRVVRLDLAGKVYRTTISLNATGLLEGWEICNGSIIGACTGKPVLDTIGSRFGTLRKLTIKGDQTNRPTVGIQAARSSFQPNLYGFCDGMLWDQVHTTGYFSTTAVHAYGQEGTTYSRCQFWNSDRDAYVGVHTGYSSVPMFSDYMTPVTGSQSYINNKYMGCDYMYLAEGQNASITGISKANPAVVTAPGHPFVNGQTVALGYVSGMTEINNTVAVVAGVTADTFQLTGVNSTAFSTYTGGGFVCLAQTKPTVLFARGEQHHFDTCYVVNYGSDSIAIDFPDGHPLKSVWFDVLFEGAGSRSHIRFLAAGDIRDFKLNTYNTHARDYIMSAAVAGTVALFKPDIVVTNFSVSTPVLVSDPTRFAMYDANVFVPFSNTLPVAGASSLQDRFIGTIQDTSAQSTHVNEKYQDYRDGAYTPVVTPGSGSLTAYAATGFSRRIGDMVYVEIDITVTTKGTAAGNINVTLPYAAAARSGIAGREYQLVGFPVVGLGNGAASNVMSISKYDGLTPFSTDGNKYFVSGWYRAA